MGTIFRRSCQRQPEQASDTRDQGRFSACVIAFCRDHRRPAGSRSPAPPRPFRCSDACCAAQGQRSKPPGPAATPPGRRAGPPGKRPPESSNLKVQAGRAGPAQREACNEGSSKSAAGGRAARRREKSSEGRRAQRQSPRSTPHDASSAAKTGQGGPPTGRRSNRAARLRALAGQQTRQTPRLRRGARIPGRCETSARRVSTLYSAPFLQPKAGKKASL